MGGRVVLRHADILMWDVVNWSNALRYWTCTSAIPIANACALEIGASDNGGLSLWLAEQGARIVCSDRYHYWIVQSRMRHASFPIASSIQYQVVDVTALPYRDVFDVVVLRSVLGGIGGPDDLTQQAQALREIHAALKPGGEFWFAENLSGSALHRVCRWLFQPSRHHWRYFTLSELPVLLHSFASYQYELVGWLGAFGRTERQRRVLGYLDEFLCQRLHLIPAAWHYIVVGIARK
jgi:2-polyprenyl-3-methyl-5-hydroxy-6-metoxy-1,4-benzoquinol methylase